MEINGTVREVLDEVSGTSSSSGNQWKKREFILEIPGQYPKQVCIVGWAERADEIGKLQAGEQLTAHIDVESREYNGRWYTDVKTWKLERNGGAQGVDSATEREENFASAGKMTPDDDLPF